MAPPAPRGGERGGDADRPAAAVRTPSERVNETPYVVSYSSTAVGSGIGSAGAGG
jgi:hypothetical protein